MRWSLASVLVVASACGSSEQGALLVLDAPEGVTAERIEIILASADPMTIEDVQNQRVQPADLEQEQVRYYRQRAITGEIDGVGTLDGFSVRLEPNIEVPEGALIPFLIAFDGQDQITAIGSVLDNGMPGPVEIQDGQLLRFEVSMVALTPTDGAAGIAANEVLRVSCGNFESGIAWQPGGTQLRLLLPDRSQNADATDASARKADMDCDGGKAIADDCDDLRSEFHAGAVEMCDGVDHDCDFASNELVPCDGAPAGCSTSSVGICPDRPGTTNTTVACAPDPECACELGNCAACVIPVEGADGAPTVTACSPSIAHDVFIESCSGGCEVAVLERPGDPFRVRISMPGTNMFTDKLPTVADKIDIAVDTFDQFVAQPGDIVGGIFLAVTPTGGAPIQVSFAIKLGGRITCAADGDTMVCSQP